MSLAALDLSLLFEVQLVPDYHNGDVLVVLDADDLFSEAYDFLQRSLGCDAENQQKPLATLHVQVSHGHYCFFSLVSGVFGNGQYLPNCSVPAVSRLQRFVSQGSYQSGVTQLTSPASPVGPGCTASVPFHRIIARALILSDSDSHRRRPGSDMSPRWSDHSSQSTRCGRTELEKGVVSPGQRTAHVALRPCPTNLPVRQLFPTPPAAGNRCQQIPHVTLKKTRPQPAYSLDFFLTIAQFFSWRADDENEA